MIVSITPVILHSYTGNLLAELILDKLISFLSFQIQLWILRNKKHPNSKYEITLNT